jgi:hypothetical protein
VSDDVTLLRHADARSAGHTIEDPDTEGEA